MKSRKTLAAAALALTLGLAAAAALLFASPFAGGSEDGALKAVIVDQLSLTFPNSDFTEEATATLEAAGYRVDYVPGEETDVDFFRELPSHGYDVVLLRTHSARYEGLWQNEHRDLIEIFTSEPYTLDTHLDEQQQGRLGVVSYFSDPDKKQYFGITPDFITDSMRGGFAGATVIMMGCNGLSTASTADAFLAKGAAEVIGWDEAVSAGHTDEATLSLLRHMLDGGLAPDAAVAATMDEVGPDLAYNSTLRTHQPGG
jgi:hypothetical protein